MKLKRAFEGQESLWSPRKDAAISFVIDLFGGGSTKVTAKATPSVMPMSYRAQSSFNVTTGDSGGLSIGPTGGSLRVSLPAMQKIGQYGSRTTQDLTRTGGPIDDLRGNANPFIQL